MGRQAEEYRPAQLPPSQDRLSGPRYKSTLGTPHTVRPTSRFSHAKRKGAIITSDLVVVETIIIASIAEPSRSTLSVSGGLPSFRELEESTRS